jgi:hypothetical protein
MQSINVIESPRLRKLFLLLREELKDSDIPGRTTIRKHIEKTYQDHLKQLEEDMTVCMLASSDIDTNLIMLQNSVGKISFTTDNWSDPNRASFMAVTAHWIEAIDEMTTSGVHKKLQLRADLIGFHKIPGRHTGEHLAHCFLFITDRIKITPKVSAISTVLSYLNPM